MDKVWANIQGTDISKEKSEYWLEHLNLLDAWTRLSQSQLCLRSWLEVGYRLPKMQPVIPWPSTVWLCSRSTHGTFHCICSPHIRVQVYYYEFRVQICACAALHGRNRLPTETWPWLEAYLRQGGSPVTTNLYTGGFNHPWCIALSWSNQPWRLHRCWSHWWRFVSPYHVNETGPSWNLV